MITDPSAEEFIKNIIRSTDQGELLLDERGEHPQSIPEVIHEIEDFLAESEASSPEEVALLCRKLKDALASGVGDAEDIAKAQEILTYLIDRYK